MDMERSHQMSLVKCKDTKPELVIRRLVWGMGYRYRLYDGKLPGKPDIVFKSRHKVIFVHGCFWHRHDGCKNARMPKTRLDFWEKKLSGNHLRDLENQKKLVYLGWSFLVIWECELKNLMNVETKIIDFLDKI